MLVWLFTIVDMIILLVVLLTQLGLATPWRILTVCAAVLILKGIAFKGEFMSVVDLIFGVYIILMIFGARWFISYLLMFWLAYKIFFAFIRH
ncbi:hypothetical protein C4573_01370 [Candidatus Woesearchaeota archaeon]|nr:MAG: hypothetical protein C4573_01370 [Candidatus Woesearchaeota archaeon]